MRTAARARAPQPGTATAERWQRVRKVLAVRLDNLGDLLMTTPALAAIQHGLPQARITALVSPGAAAGASHMPCIDQVITFEAPWVKAPHGVDDQDAALGSTALIERLRAQAFDAAVIFTVCTQSALPAAMLCLLAGIPLRLAHSRENPYELLTDWVPETDVVADGMRHEVARQLALVAAVGLQPPPQGQQLQFNVWPRNRIRLRRQLGELGIDADRPYVVVHPGATAASRRWPAERFGEAADAIHRDTGCLPLFTGDASEQGLVEQARAAMHAPSVSLAGQLRLGELAALISGARLLIANNTGPAHLAAAVGTPVVDLYAATNPQHTPWRVPSRVLNHPVPCRHCLKSACPEGHHDCLRLVTPQQVVDAARELLVLPRQPMRPEPLDSTDALAALPAWAAPALHRSTRPLIS